MKAIETDMTLDELLMKRHSLGVELAEARTALCECESRVFELASQHDRVRLEIDAFIAVRAAQLEGTLSVADFGTPIRTAVGEMFVNDGS